MPVGVKQNKKKRRQVGLPGSFATNELASAFDPGALDAVYGNYNKVMHPDGMGLNLPPEVRIAAALAQIPQGLDALPTTAPNVPRIQTNKRQFGMPIRGDTQLGQEMTAGIDAMAGIGSRVPFNAGVRMNPGVQSVARDPRNPQLGRYATGETPQAAIEPSLAEIGAMLAQAESGAGGMREAAKYDGIYHMPVKLPTIGPNGQALTTDAGRQAMRAIALRQNPDYQYAVEANRRLGKMTDAGLLTDFQVSDPNSPFYSPPMQTSPVTGAMSAKEFRSRVGAQATKNQAARAADPVRQAVTERAKARYGKSRVGAQGIGADAIIAEGLNRGNKELAMFGMAMKQQELQGGQQGVENAREERKVDIMQQQANNERLRFASDADLKKREMDSLEPPKPGTAAFADSAAQAASAAKERGGFNPSDLEGVPLDPKEAAAYAGRRGITAGDLHKFANDPGPFPLARETQMPLTMPWLLGTGMDEFQTRMRQLPGAYRLLQAMMGQ